VYPSKDIVQTALAVPALSTLVKAVVAGNLTGALSQPNGPYTVFAPTDTAFGKLPQGELDYLLTHPKELDAVLLYHVLPQWVYSTQIYNLEAARTLNGQDLVFFIDGSNVIINGYSNVVQANVDCSNGEVHLIDTVLIPNAVRERMNAVLGVSSGAPLPNIVQLAEQTPQLSTLVKAVVAGGLVNTLEGPGPFTVFAPNDAAFAALPNGVLAYLLSHVTDLDTVLTYHVVAGNVTSNMLTNGEQVPTVEGANVTVHISGSSVYINQAQVIAANVFASNGVVHLIDSVLLPPALF